VCSILSDMEIYQHLLLYVPSRTILSISWRIAVPRGETSFSH